MATPHPHYPQPGPSSIPYHPPPPPPYAFGGNSPYQNSHQLPPNSVLSPPPPRLANGAGHATYPHQGPGHSTSGFHPHFPHRQQYQPGLYQSMDHPHRTRPPQPPYQQQHLVNGAPLGRQPNGPLRQGQFIHPTAHRHPLPPFSPSFHPHNHSFPHSSPSSPSALPKQLLMPPPTSPLQSQTLSAFPSTQAPLDQQIPASTQELQHPAEPLTSSSVPILPVPPPSRVQQIPSLTQDFGEDQLAPLSPSSSDLTLTSVRKASEPHQAFPDRTDIRKGFALQSRRPTVIEAVPFTVSSAARPPLSFYDSLTVSEEAENTLSRSSQSPPANELPLTPPPDIKAFTDTPDEPDSPPSQGLASSATTTTTPATSTAPHTPTPGSPHSSMTSVSLLNKSPSSVMRDVSPSPSSTKVTTRLVVHDMENAPELPLVQQSQMSSASTPTPPPVKKTWASLLRPASNGGLNTAGAAGSNGLPTSSVQGFSIPASSSAMLTGHRVPQSSPDIFTLLTAPNALIGQVPAVRTRGIVNLGNMCFANTVLQVLVYSPPFHKLFTELDKHVPGPKAKENGRVDVTGTPLVNATVTFLKEFRVLTPPHSSKGQKEEEEEDKGRDSLVPSYIYEALKEKKRFDSMRGGQQEDAEEFLGFYLDTLEEELLSMIKGSPLNSASTSSTAVEDQVDQEDPSDEWLEVGKKNRTVVTRTHKTLESPISRIFGGKFRTELRVPGARQSAMIDPWSRLQLDIQPDYVYTIEDALRNIATPGTVHVTSSSRPGIQVDASQQTLIEMLPPILVLHLKRFLYDTAVNDVVKLSKKIVFGTELEIPKEIMAPPRRSRPTKYKLFGVLNHHGGSATGGHYTLDVLHPDPCEQGREGWIRIDDEFVQNIGPDDLPARDVGDDRSAYLLFYRRVHSPGSGVL